MILKVHHAQITIPKNAENEARVFYCDFLGLREVPKPESLQGRGLAGAINWQRKALKLLKASRFPDTIVLNFVIRLTIAWNF